MGKGIKQPQGGDLGRVLAFPGLRQQRKSFRSSQCVEVNEGPCTSLGAEKPLHQLRPDTDVLISMKDDFRHFKSSNTYPVLLNTRCESAVSGQFNCSLYRVSQRVF